MDEFENTSTTLQQFNQDKDTCQQHEIVSGLSTIDFEEFLTISPKDSFKFNDEIVKSFVHGSQKVEEMSQALFDDDEDDEIILATQISPKKFTFDNEMKRNKSPPRKIQVIEQKKSLDLDKMFSRKPKTSESAVDIAMRKIQEEKSKKKVIVNEILGNNENNTFPSFISANQQLHIRNVMKSDNVDNIKGTQQPTQNVRVGLSKSQFKPPFQKNNDEKVEKNLKINDEIENHPLLKNVNPEILEMIKNEVTDCTQNVKFDDIAGLEEAKKAIYEAVIVPLLRPELFKGLRTIPKGILLFGPPGTGKTMIGKCIASHANATFFSISSATLTSKWIGEGEKLVQALFLYARVKQPSVIFIDEIDSILTKRGENEHESNRRLKTQFLIALEGADSRSDDRVLFIGATNLPQELDDAVIRRLTKRLYIPLPDFPARMQLLKNLLRLNDNSLSEEDFRRISNATEGYSGSDMKNLCEDAAMQPFREIPIDRIQSIDEKNLRPINIKDFIKSMESVKATVSSEKLDFYIEWNKKYGSTKI